MTSPAPERESEKLYVTDEELIKRLGVPENVAWTTLRMFDSDPRKGFPQKQKLWGDRRYWPAVKDYLDRVNGLKPRAGAARLATENRDRTRLLRPSPAVPLRRSTNDRQ